MDLSKASDGELVKELERRNKVKKAQAWSKIEKVRAELYTILNDSGLCGDYWNSVSETIGDEAQEFFEGLWGACGGNDIGRILKDASTIN